MKKIIIIASLSFALVGGAMAYNAHSTSSLEDSIKCEGGLRCFGCKGTGFQGSFNCHLCKGSGRSGSY